MDKTSGKKSKSIIKERNHVWNIPTVEGSQQILEGQIWEWEVAHGSSQWPRNPKHGAAFVDTKTRDRNKQRQIEKEREMSGNLEIDIKKNVKRRKSPTRDGYIETWGV